MGGRQLNSRAVLVALLVIKMSAGLENFTRSDINISQETNYPNEAESNTVTGQVREKLSLLTFLKNERIAYGNLLRNSSTNGNTIDPAQNDDENLKNEYYLNKFNRIERFMKMMLAHRLKDGGQNNEEDNHEVMMEPLRHRTQRNKRYTNNSKSYNLLDDLINTVRHVVDFVGLGDNTPCTNTSSTR